MTVWRQKVFFLFWITLIIALGCQKVIEEKPKIVTGEVTIVFPDTSEPLTALLKEYFLVVTVEGKVLFSSDTILAPTPIVPSEPIKNISLEAGNKRVFTTYGVSSGGIPLWWAQKIVDLPVKEDIKVKLSMVSAGFGAASHIAIFRDDLSWDANTIEEVLAEEGITQGTGTHQYEIFTSDKFSSVLGLLSPETDMMIIAADQEQVFYDNYAANRVDIEEFVIRGGVLFWEAVDKGFHNGSITGAGIFFPGPVFLDFEYEFEDYNTVVNLDYPLTENLPRPDSIHGNKASHGNFVNFLSGIQVLTRGVPSGDETLELYPWGVGWVILSAQPLEFNYAQRRGQPNDRDYAIGLLLPRIIRFFFGRPVT